MDPPEEEEGLMAEGRKEEEGRGREKEARKREVNLSQIFESRARLR